MNKIVRKLAIGIGIFLAIFLLTALIITSVFQDEIGDKIVGELNKTIKSELAIKNFDLSLISSFPNLSANLQGVNLEDAFGEVLLEAKEVSFKLGLFSLFGSTIKVKSIEVADGALNVHIDRKGRENFDILEPSETEDSAGNTGIKVNEARLTDMEVIYRDDREKQSIRTDVEDLVIEGDFESDKFDLISSAKIKSHFVEIGSTRYLVGTDVEYDAKIYANLKTGVYDFERVALVIEDNIFNVDGFIETPKDLTDFDLSFTSNNANLESVIQLLPAQFLKDVGDLSSTGEFQFEANVLGHLTDTEFPKIEVKVSLEDGKISSPRLSHSLKDVSFSASFTNGKDQNNSTSVFEIPNLKGYFNRELIEMSLKVRDLDDPRIEFKSDGVIPLASTYKMFNSPIVTDGSGEIEFKNLRLSGRYKDMLSTSRVKRVDLSGEIEFDDAALEVSNEEIIIDRGNLGFKDNVLSVSGIKINGMDSEVELDGTFYNILPVLFADEENTNQAELRFQASLNGRKMDLARIVKLTGTGVDESDVEVVVYDSLRTANTQKRARITDLLKGTFNANVEEFTYNKIEGTYFTGNLEFDNNEMTIEGKAFGMDGSFDLDGTVYLQNQPYLVGKLTSNEVNIKEFFRQSGNFGQETLKSKHVKGNMNAKLLIYAYWDSRGNFLMDKLNVLGAVGVRDGELKNFKLLEEFSNYIHLPDLRTVRFMNLEQWIEVRKGRVYLPAMFIQSNALNITISGEHSFENDIDYNLQLNAGQVIMTKLKKHDRKLIPVPAKRKGLFNLYYNINGTIDEFDYKTAKKEVKNAFRRSEHHKREIKSQLAEVFGEAGVLKEEVKEIPEWEDEFVDPDEEEYIDWGGDNGY
jgi:hypothetical protein